VSFKKKNIILLITAVFSLYLSWTLAIHETVELSSSTAEMEQRLEAAKEAPNEIKRLELELDKVKGKTRKLYSGVQDLRKLLLSEVTALADLYELTLKSFPEHFMQQKEGMELSTSPVVLSGAYKDMLQMIYEFEQNEIAGKISSVVFEIEESPRTRNRKLFMTLYVQSINQ
jgi:predicted nuclease with TOPRIM domain